LSGQLQNFLSGQKNTIPSGLNSYNFDAGLDYENTTGSKRLQAAELSRQKLSASPRQKYSHKAARHDPYQFSRHYPFYSHRQIIAQTVLTAILPSKNLAASQHLEGTIEIPTTFQLTSS
jgi:hypothetical protein